MGEFFNRFKHFSFNQSQGVDSCNIRYSYVQQIVVLINECHNSGLRKYYEYNVSVSASTEVGQGPFSPHKIIRTLEDGMLFYTVYTAHC